MTTNLNSLAAGPDIHIPITLTALSPISHGAGTSGNTQLLRTRDVITAAGTRATVPYVSGNSLRHLLRSALAWHLVRTLEIPEKSLPKRVVDLLWSGGALTSTGNQVDLERTRRVHTLVPALGLMGYSAQSDIAAGTLYVDDAELVCAENSGRIPPRLHDHPQTRLNAGALRAETFGTRHDVVGSPADRFIQLMGETTESTQMIYDIQVIKPGSVLYTSLHLQSPTPGHSVALATAISEAAPALDGRPVMSLGGRRSSGFGNCAASIDTGALGDLAEMKTRYENHLKENADGITALLAEMTA